MSRTIGGNPLRNAAIRQGNPLGSVGSRLRAAADRLKAKKAVRPYTDEDRARLLAPIQITTFGGKTFAGVSRSSGLMHHGGASKGDHDDIVSDRYAQRSDWADLDRIER